MNGENSMITYKNNPSMQQYIDRIKDAGYVVTWQCWRTYPYQESIGKRRKRFVVQVLSREQGSQT
jgi:hypothetical protein